MFLERPCTIPRMCSFEGQRCGYSSSGKVHWLHRNGYTATTTGPKTDHTLETKLGQRKSWQIEIFKFCYLFTELYRLLLFHVQVTTWWSTQTKPSFPPAPPLSSPPSFNWEAPEQSVCISGTIWEEGTLVSKVLTQNTHWQPRPGETCLNSVHLAGYLTVYVKPEKGERVKIFSENLNQGDIWHLGNGNVTSGLASWQVHQN